MAKYLEHCNVKNLAVTHELSSDKWFEERIIDFAVCKKCDTNLLGKRFKDYKGNSIETTISGLEKVQRKYDRLLRDKIQTYDNTFKQERGPFYPNMHFADDGIMHRMNGTRPGYKYSGGRWLEKIGSKYR